MIETSSVPRVSVILPTYRRNEYLRPALDSAVAQTYRDIEIIVSDNGPSAEVEELVRSYGDPRLRYRHNGGNIGAMRNALAAYACARGAYIVTLHDDDLWEPTYLARLVPALEADPDLTVAFADHSIMRPDGTVDERTSERNTRLWGRAGLREGVHRPFYRLAIIDRAVSIITTVYRRSAFDWSAFPREVGPLYDFWLAYLACREGLGAYYVPERLTHYRVHPDQLSRGDPFLQPKAYCYHAFLADERLAPIRADIKRLNARVDISLGLSLLEAGRRADARRHLLAALPVAPELRGLGGLMLSLLPNPGFAIARGRDLKRRFVPRRHRT
jgi:glycosyltransferase involved in cell wall biosynthesis